VSRRMMQLEFALDQAPPQQVRPGGSLRRLMLPGGWLWYGFVRARRRTLTIVVDRDRVEVRAPRWTPIGEIEAFIRDKEPWIRRRVAEGRRAPPAFSWREGEQLPVLGEPVRIALAGGAGTRRSGNRIEVGLAQDAPAPLLRAAVLEWLASEATRLFAQRVAEYAPRLGVPIPEMRLSNARTQWGSCNARGRVLLNWRLIHVPLRLIDYVVVHELAHLRELNHSQRFWALVEKAYPGCRGARRELNRIEKQLPEL
jgi:predicted metal-dependent hydrolase